jgi:DNA-binding response OmpR family regulator
MMVDSAEVVRVVAYCRGRSLRPPFFVLLPQSSGTVSPSAPLACASERGLQGKDALSRMSRINLEDMPEARTMKILIVEDDKLISSTVKRGLEKSNYEVEVAENGRSGLEMALDRPFSLIILDLMLPGMDGMSVCRGLRSRKVSTPVLMLTARDSLDDRVEGLDTGADDYLVKPFEFPELLARIRALIRRDHVYKGSIIQVGDLEVDRVYRTVRRAGKEIHLSEREFTLLEALAANEGRVLSREYIRDRVWCDEDSFSNNVDSCIKQIRKKIDADPLPKLIQTVHGMGYTLRESKG